MIPPVERGEIKRGWSEKVTQCSHERLTPQCSVCESKPYRLYPQLVEMLRGLEWVDDICPVCGARELWPESHANDCELAALLKEVE